MFRYVVLASITVVSSSAGAQPAGAQAEVLFRQGRELLAAGKVAEACAAFDESQKLEAAITTLINLAGCREKNNQLATAWGLFLDAERQTRTATDEATRQLHDIAQDRAQKLEPRVSKLTINVPQQSQLNGLEIARDGDRIEAVMWNRALPIDGGTYKVSARAPGSSQWTTTVSVGAEQDTKTIDVPDLRSLPRDLEAKPPTTSTKTDEMPEPAHTASKRVPIVVGVGGLALLGGGLAFELWGESTYAAAKAETTNQARRDSLVRSANTKRYVAEGLSISGVAAAGVAVWLYWRHRDETKLIPPRALVVSPAGVAFVGAF